MCACIAFGVGSKVMHTLYMQYAAVVEVHVVMHSVMSTCAYKCKLFLAYFGGGAEIYNCRSNTISFHK